MTNKSGLDFHVVGIGASAGGLEALERFFSNMPPDSGIAFVVIQHLSPDYESHMDELLSKYTHMPIYEAQDGTAVQPNTIYLLPRRKNMTIFKGRLYLVDYERSRGLNLPIDIFLQSLAEDQAEMAIGIILSGTGSDGTRGIRAIKEVGGMVMAQDDSAKFDGMPRSAVATQLVDYIAPAEEMPQNLLNYIQHPCLATDPALKPAIATDEDMMGKLFAVLKQQTGADFTDYKPNTIIRRIERRMSVTQIEDLTDYVNYLQISDGECQTLYKEFLIGVTRFFRDPEAFDILYQRVLPMLFADKPKGTQLRIWVTGCSTGEEAYSLAMIFWEYMEQTNRYLDVKIFATDLDKQALEYASTGAYPESIAADLSPDRLRNFFVKKGDVYEISRQIRTMVVFAHQNILIDPPFSKIDLISCRNLLIYLQPVLQKKVLATFQFALNTGGYLFLGNSETVGDYEDVFHAEFKKWRIYEYRGGQPPLINASGLGPLRERN
ncbi:MAG: chemotaxis protein CheB, partial [Anaerolineae bacterium]|nr:chemotaxis protein CheB [Anaerolineae bacterium]